MSKRSEKRTNLFVINWNDPCGLELRFLFHKPTSSLDGLEWTNGRTYRETDIWTLSGHKGVTIKDYRSRHGQHHRRRHRHGRRHPFWKTQSMSSLRWKYSHVNIKCVGICSGSCWLWYALRPGAQDFQPAATDVDKSRCRILTSAGD